MHADLEKEAGHVFFFLKIFICELMRFLKKKCYKSVMSVLLAWQCFCLFCSNGSTYIHHREKR